MLLAEALSASAYHIAALRGNLDIHPIFTECLTLIEEADEDLAKCTETFPSMDGLITPESTFEVVSEGLFDGIVKFYYQLIAEYGKNSDMSSYLFPGGLSAIGDEPAGYLLSARTLVSRLKYVDIDFAQEWQDYFNYKIDEANTAATNPPKPHMDPLIRKVFKKWKRIYRSNKAIIQGILIRAKTEERMAEFFREEFSPR